MKTNYIYLAYELIAYRSKRNLKIRCQFQYILLINHTLSCICSCVRKTPHRDQYALRQQADVNTQYTILLGNGVIWQEKTASRDTEEKQ